MISSGSGYKLAFAHALDLIEYQYGSNRTGLIECIGLSYRNGDSNSSLDKHTQLPD